MSSWFVWYILSWLIGNPVLALVVLGGLWAAEHYTVGVLPTPLRFFRRWGRRSTLRRRIAVNPHDRQARFELADLLLDAGKPKPAMPLLRANVEAGDDDAQTLMLLGKACARANHPEQAVKMLRAALEENPKVRSGEGWLELGRALLAQGAFGPARAALESFKAQRTGTVEGRVLLARALDGEKRADAAKAMRAEAWREYTTSPRYLQRQERLWAWRIKPSRPALYGVLAVAVLCALVWGGGRVSLDSERGFGGPFPGAARASIRPELAEAITTLGQLIQDGSKAPGAEVLRSEGCATVYVGDRARYEAVSRQLIAAGYTSNHSLLSAREPLLIKCNALSTVSCDALAARYVQTVGHAASAFSVVAYGRAYGPECQADYAVDGHRL